MCVNFGILAMLLCVCQDQSTLKLYNPGAALCNGVLRPYSALFDLRLGAV
jgi:hypothetical protein